MSHPDSGHGKSLSWRADAADTTVERILLAPAKVGLFVGVAGGGVEGLDGVAAVGGGGGCEVTFPARNMIQLVCAPTCVGCFVRHAGRGTAGVITRRRCCRSGCSWIGS